MKWGLRSGAALLFCVAATLNSGGYRYGIADQAFYIPAVLRHLNPAFFARDRALIDVQDRWLLFNGAAAEVVARTGLSLPVLFLVAYVVGLLLLWGGLSSLGRSFYRSSWTIAALTAAMTLRHRITRTGVNTLEGYLHPRMLVFALGVGALALFLNGRSYVALGLMGLAMLIHPTTALWFGIWLGVAILVASRPRPRAVLALTVTGAVAVPVGAFIAARSGLLADAMTRMDAGWLSVLSGKDYLFPTEWPLAAWAINLGTVLVVIAIFEYRRRVGALLAREDGLVIGCLALVAIFLVSVPWTFARVALAVQLQVSRVFWMVDLLATVYVIWWLAEAGQNPAKAGPHERLEPGPDHVASASPIEASDLGPTSSPIVASTISSPPIVGSGFSRTLRPRALSVAAVLIVATFVRGGYVTFVEHAGRPLVEMRLPTDPWHDAMRWIAANTQIDAHVLADPGHAWRYGTSVRVAGERDVYLEEVKDTAMAMYSRPIAVRVSNRIQELGDFTQLTEGPAQALAASFGLDYLVIDRRLDFPVAYQNAQFTVYRLGAFGGPRRASSDTRPAQFLRTLPN